VKYVAILNAHDHADVVDDTISSIKSYMTDDIMVVVDGAHWKEFSKNKFDAYLLEGLWHNYSRSPYRNVALGLIQTAKKWPNADWYCYLEYDCLFTSSDFKRNVERSGMMGYVCLGFDHRRQKMKLPLLDKILKQPIRKLEYLLGCCVFYEGRFIRKASPVLERLLLFTNDFTQGFFPEYEKQGGYDFMEHFMPTLARCYGRVGGMCRWNEQSKHWTDGDYKKYTVRFRPELTESEIFEQSSICHPVKEFDNPVRKFHRDRREVHV